MSGDIETFHERGWHNRIEGEAGVISSHYDAESAISTGREAARERGVGHIIKNIDGTVAERNRYRDTRRDVPGDSPPPEVARSSVRGKI